MGAQLTPQINTPPYILFDNMEENPFCDRIFLLYEEESSMGVVTSTATRKITTEIKTIRVAWKDSSPRRRKNASKAAIERKEKIDEVVDEKFSFPFPLY